MRTLAAQPPTSALTPQEQNEFTECERVIEQGWKTFLNVGNALITIRDKKLYRDSHETIEDYCRVRWGYARSHAYRMIDAARLAKILSPNGDMSPDLKEAHLRPLAGLDDTQVRQVWKKVNADFPQGKITAPVVRKCVHALFPVTGKPAKKPASTDGTPDHIKEVAKALTKMVGLVRVADQDKAKNLKREIIAILRSRAD